MLVLMANRFNPFLKRKEFQMKTLENMRAKLSYLYTNLTLNWQNVKIEKGGGGT
jgi:hypothetical protein